MLPPFIARSIAAAPGAVITTGQLGRMQVPRRWVAALIEEGDLERILYGVHRDPAAEQPDSQPLHVALAYLGQRRPASCPPDLITGEAALAACGVPDLGMRCPTVLVHETRRCRRLRPAFDLRRVDLRRVPTHTAARAAVAAPSRAVADLALDPRVPDRLIRTTVDDLRNRRLLDIVHATGAWAALDNPGGRRLTAMVAEGCFEQESEGERRAFQQLFVPFGALPDCQVWVTPSIRVDFVFLSAALVIEYHGPHHDATADEDATRIWALRLLGFDVIVVTRSMMRDAPALAERIRSLRLEREQLILAGHLRRPLPIGQPPRLTPLRTLHLP